MVIISSKHIHIYHVPVKTRNMMCRYALTLSICSIYIYYNMYYDVACDHCTHTSPSTSFVLLKGNTSLPCSTLLNFQIIYTHIQYTYTQKLNRQHFFDIFESEPQSCRNKYAANEKNYSLERMQIGTLNKVTFNRDRTKAQLTFLVG